MNKLLISLLLSSTLIGGVQAQKKENYYVKHVEFPQDATLEQKVDMAARLAVRSSKEKRLRNVWWWP